MAPMKNIKLQVFCVTDILKILVNPFENVLGKLCIGVTPVALSRPYQGCVFPMNIFLDLCISNEFFHGFVFMFSNVSEFIADNKLVLRPVPSK